MGANSVFVPRGRVTEYKVCILEVIDPRTPTDMLGLMKDLVVTLVRYFPALVEDHVFVQTSGRNIDIPAELWPDISRDIESIKVISRACFTFLGTVVS